MTLNNLALAFQSLYKCNEKEAFLDEAIQLYRQMLELCPLGYPLRDLCLHKLALSLLLQYKQANCPVLIEEVVQLKREAVSLYLPTTDLLSVLVACGILGTAP